MSLPYTLLARIKLHVVKNQNQFLLSATNYQDFNNHTNHAYAIGNTTFDGKHAGAVFKDGTHHVHSMVDTCEKVTLSWSNVNVYVKPPERMCCRGPDPRVPMKHVLRDGENYTVKLLTRCRFLFSNL